MQALLKKTWSFLGRNFQLIAICLTVAGVGWALYSQRQAIADFDWSINAGGLAIAILLMAMGPIFQSFSFWDALRAFGPRPQLLAVVVVWCRSFLLRYSPTGALAFVYRVRQGVRLDADNKQILAASAYEQYAALQAGLTIAVACFWIDGGSIPIWAIGLFAAGLLLALLARPQLLGGRVKSMMANRGIELPELLQGRRIIQIVSFNLIAWVLVAYGNWLLFRSLAPDVDVSLLYFSASFILACVVGIIIPMLPGGLGVREAVLVALLAPVMPAGVAVTIVIGLRIVATIAEFVAIGLGEIAYLAGKKLTKK